MKALFICAFSFFLSVPAFASDALLFGPEFTFWVPAEGRAATQDETLEAKYQVSMHMARHLVENQREGAKFKKINTRFESPNGWWFDVTLDQGVLEVLMSPMTAENFEKYSADIHDAVFVSMANKGYFPALFGGGGHISISGDYLTSRPKLLYNFIVDLINHNELFTGVFGYDTNNALPFDLRQLERQQDAVKILEDFRGNLTALGVATFLTRWNNNLASESNRDSYLKYWSQYVFNRVEKYHAFNLRELKAEPSTNSRIELRAVRPQTSAMTWARQVRLLKKRIQYLESLSEPLKIQPRIKVQGIHEFRIITDDEAMTPPVDPQEALRSFFLYVTEAGEKWQDHRDYVWPQWISDGELSAFEGSDWYKTRVLKTCSALLSGSRT